MRVGALAAGGARVGRWAVQRGGRAEPRVAVGSGSGWAPSRPGTRAGGPVRWKCGVDWVVKVGWGLVVPLLPISKRAD